MDAKDVATLEQLGFFVHVPEAERAAARAHAQTQPNPFHRYTRRRYWADATELRKGGVISVLGGLAPYLRRQGVPIEATYRVVDFPATPATATQPAQPRRTGQWALAADGWLEPEDFVDARTPVDTLTVVSKPGMHPYRVTERMDFGKSHTHIVLTGRSWTVVDPKKPVDSACQAARTLMRLLSSLLEEHGSPERAYGMYAGYDFGIVFLTPAMAKLLRAKCPSSERPHDASPEALLAWRPLSLAAAPRTAP